jgi:hypothetical protein
MSVHDCGDWRRKRAGNGEEEDAEGTGLTAGEMRRKRGYEKRRKQRKGFWRRE